MDALITLLLKSSIILIVFYAVFIVFLRKESHFILNRLFLIFTLISSLTLPFIQIPVITNPVSEEFNVFLQTVTVSAGQTDIKPLWSLSPGLLVLLFYLCGVLVFIARFVLRLYRVLSIVKQFGIVTSGAHKIVFTDGSYASFSFFGLIFMPKAIDENDALKIITHESAHIRQKHSTDIILMELVSIVHWFNPLIGFIRQSLRDTHEFLADAKVISEGFKKFEYQQLILKTGLHAYTLKLSNNFNASQIKKRFIMMTKSKPGLYVRLKFWVVLSTLTVMLAVFVCGSVKSILPFSPEGPYGRMLLIPDTTKKAQSAQTPAQKSEPFQIVDEMPVFGNNNNDLIDYISKNVVYPQQAKEKGIQGKVFVSFIVTKEGKVKDAKVVKPVNDLLDAEAVRVVSSMPKWKPGYNKGKAVDVICNLPINFKLN